MSYRVIVMSAARRGYAKLPEAVAAAIPEVLLLLAENPQRVGKPLRNELKGFHDTRRGDYRIVYEILEEEGVVLVTRIGHRRSVYR